MAYEDLNIKWPENPVDGQLHLVDGRPKYNYQLAFQYNDGQWWRNYQHDRDCTWKIK